MLEAEDSTTGIDMARSHQPDAVITELAMTNIDGLSLVQHLRNDPTMAQTTIVVSSAHVFDEDRQKSLAAGANFFLPKPLKMDDLLSVLQQSLKLEWLYQEASAAPASIASSTPAPPEQNQETSSTLSAPESDILDQLYHLTMMGDLNGLKGILDQLDADNPELGGFTAHIRTLVNQFQTKQIREFIKSFTSLQS